MGLRIATDLSAWHAWQGKRHTLRRILTRARGGSSRPAGYLLGRRGTGTLSTVVALESHSSSSLLSLGTPLERLANPDVGVLVPDFFDRAHMPGWVWTPWDGSLAPLLPDGGVVLSGGHYLPLGAMLHHQATGTGIRFTTVQHGLMTPWAPPLAPDSHLLAWSRADADFWRSGRSDVTASVVGSQLLWNAAQTPGHHVSRFVTPIFLGQLHGAELPRWGMVRAATEFCRSTGATYRPHPSERDRLSRLQHAAWERMGITVDRSGIPLSSIDRPVVSAFSTGILEAAARGVPSWAFYPDPPAWLEEFWSRYGLRRWGDAPTAAPETPAVEPAQAIADWIRSNA